MKGLVLSGGKGTRLRPLTYTGAKQLVPVANKPVLFYVFKDLVEAGVTEIGIVISPETGEQVKQEAGDGSRFGAHFTYIPQSQPLGIAHGIKIAQEFIGDEPFILFLGDNFIRGGIVPQVNAFRGQAMDAQIILYEMQDPSSMGVAVLNTDGSVARVVEKPKQFISPYAVIGIYMFGPAVFDAVHNIKPSARGELEITDTIQYLVDRGLNVRAHKLTDAWVDTGRIGDMLEANRLVLDVIESKNQGKVENSVLEGRVVLEEGAQVINSKIRGPAIIGKNTIVENAFVGPYTAIHNNCSIRQCEIEHSIVLENSRLEDLHTRIADSLIGRNVQIKRAEGPTKSMRLMLGDFSQVGIEMKTLLVTGGAGFIGSNFVRYMLQKYPQYHIVVYDKLTYAGNLDNLRDVAGDPRYAFVQGDICDAAAVRDALRANRVDTIVNFAAESHVDRSILDADAFLRTNVVGTFTLLEAAKELGLERYHQISTDEVYGWVEKPATETDPLIPRSPYAAAKASGDLMVTAYFVTHGVPTTITRGSNTVGPYQYPEKVVPLFVTNALENQPLPLYGDGMQVRDWLYVTDHCEAVDVVLHQGQLGEVYNVGGENERPNVAVVKIILDTLDKAPDLVRRVTDRSGHDRRYSLDISKTEALGWKPRHTFDQALTETIHWYANNPWWWQKIKSGEYRDYYEKQYGERLRTSEAVRV